MKYLSTHGSLDSCPAGRQYPVHKAALPTKEMSSSRAGYPFGPSEKFGWRGFEDMLLQTKIHGRGGLIFRPIQPPTPVWISNKVGPSECIGTIAVGGLV